jgi:hypothetical protein
MTKQGDTAPQMLMPLAGRSRVDESRCHTGYTGHYSLVGTYSRLRHPDRLPEKMRSVVASRMRRRPYHAESVLPPRPS